MRRLIIPILLTLSFNVYSQLPTNGLVGYYPFNGDANDNSVNNKHGIVNGATPTTNRFDYANAAYYFDGVDDYIAIPDSFMITNEFTICFWAKSENITGLSNILSDGSSAYSGNDFLLGFNGNSIRLRADKQASLNYENTSPTELQNLSLLNNWVHVVWVMEPSYSKIYLNGNELLTINTLGSNLGFHDDFALIGGRQVWGSVDSYFKGSLDDILFYNRVLTSDEISDIYNGTICTETIYDTVHVYNNQIQYLKYESYYSADDGQVNVYEIQAYNNGSNVALNKPGYANSYQGGDYSSNGIKAVDGNEYSRWSSDRDDLGPDSLNPHFIVIDLEQKVSIDSLLLNIKGFDSWNQTFDFSVSSDSINWYSVGKGLNITGIFKYIPKLPYTVYDTITVYDTVHVTKYDTVFIAVSDTLIIDAVLTGINPPNNINEIKIFPNPAKDHITIDFGNYSLMAGYTLKIINSSGQQVYITQINQQSLYLNLSDWGGKGLYYVQIIDNLNNTIETKKIILQ